MIAACLKWVDHRPGVDPLTGEVHTDPRTSGASPADDAALELALRAGTLTGHDVVVVTAGPAPADAMLRDALACGASRAVRVDLTAGATSAEVAGALTPVLAGARLVVCGDGSLDRGTGAVPAFLAAALGATQALGLAMVALEPAAGAAVTDPTGGDMAVADPAKGNTAGAKQAVGGLVVVAERRLDGGRRERLRIDLGGVLPAVLSVEAPTAPRRRASLDGVLRARTATVEVVTPAGAGEPRPAPLRVAPYRPRARTLAPPTDPSPRQRILALTGALTERTPPARVVCGPAEAADRLLEALRAWGELP